MKKVLSFLILGTLFCMNLAIAAPKTESVPEKPMDWSISMNADGTDQAPQGPQWSLILENDIGVYAYDMGSLTFGTSNGREDRNLVQTTVKTVFTNEDLLKKMNKGFAKKTDEKREDAVLPAADGVQFGGKDLHSTSNGCVRQQRDAAGNEG